MSTITIGSINGNPRILEDLLNSIVPFVCSEDTEDTFMSFFRKIAKPKPLQPALAGFIEIITEGNKVLLATVRECKDSNGKSYTTTWFDMWVVEDGLLTEHWDTARLAAMPGRPAQ